MTPDAIVDATLERVGREIVLGTPLGLGKANHLVNAFYRRAERDPSIQLTVFTALTLAVPRGASELEERLRGPMNERIFGDYPEIAWVEPLRRGELPANVVIREFYVQPGTLLGSPAAQQNYTSSNYTHVVRDLKDAGMNVLAQMVSSEEVDGRRRFSLSCNSDLTVDLLPYLLERREASGDVAILAQVNRQLPFLYGDAMVDPDVFDFVADGPQVEMPLFGPPKLPLDVADHMIGLHVSSLVRDGGTLQLGIGSLGDAIVHALRLRHGRNGVYRQVLGDLDVPTRYRRLVDDWGGTEPFARGLYAATEMLVDGFLDLYRDGILTRRVYPDADLQRRLDAGEVDPSELAGRSDGRIAHSCFFLGPQSFYEGLRSLPREERELIEMTGISFVNELYGDEELKRAQRRHARFVNSCMMMTLLGAATSDGLEDGRIVSGVGGQYNFVAMAQSLEDGRSILMLPSTRWSKGETTSNIRWNYGHTTIPRHLRDLVVTEYGIADLRGRSDADCIRAMLAVTDSRFQEELLEQAKSAGKVPADERVADAHRENTPERLADVLAPYREEHFPTFPSGTDLTDEELALAGALRRMKRKIAERDLALLPKMDEVKKLVKIPDEAAPYLERMGLADPQTAKEKLLRRAVVYALVEDGVL